MKPEVILALGIGAIALTLFIASNIPEIKEESINVLPNDTDKSMILLNNPPDSFDRIYKFNPINQTFPSIPNHKIYWEFENVIDNQDHISHIKELRLTLKDTNQHLIDFDKSKIVIKAIEVFEFGNMEEKAYEATFDELQMNLFSSETEFNWELDKLFLIQGDEVYIDGNLDLTITNNRSHPIIYVNLVYKTNNNSIEKLLDIQVIRAEMKIITNLYEEGEYSGYKSVSDGVFLIFYKNEKPENYVEEYYNE